MLSIFVTTEFLRRVQGIIASVDRLDELVRVEELRSITNSEATINKASGFVLVVDEYGIAHALDWGNQTPPYLLPHYIPLHEETLLACVFALLGNWEQVHALLVEHHLLLYAEFDAVNRLQNGIPLQPRNNDNTFVVGDSFENYRSLHNAAITLHYGISDSDSVDGNGTVGLKEILNCYERAVQAAPNAEYKAFTTLHYATFCLDCGEAKNADTLLQDALKLAYEVSLSETATFALKSVQNSAWLAQVVVPYSAELLEKLKTQLWETLSYYERTGNDVRAALVLVDASQIANYMNSFSESLGYISRAVQIFEREDLPELLGTALYRKGTLLFTWAKQGEGNPQFYKPAMQAYQDTLKIFNRDIAPQLFADVHHHLGVIYSEMPDDPQKRHIWAALSSSSFKESLNFYTKEAYPYEYGMVCTSIGNAFTKYPEGVRTDHYEKAIEYYREALSVRSAADFPEERALTLLNFLEASWYVSNGSTAEEIWNQERFDAMLRATEEIPRLTANPELVREAEQHRKNLNRLLGTMIDTINDTAQSA